MMLVHTWYKVFAPHENPLLRFGLKIWLGCHIVNRDRIIPNTIQLQPLEPPLTTPKSIIVDAITRIGVVVVVVMVIVNTLYLSLYLKHFSVKENNLQLWSTLVVVIVVCVYMPLKLLTPTMAPQRYQSAPKVLVLSSCKWLGFMTSTTPKCDSGSCPKRCNGASIEVQ